MSNDGFHALLSVGRFCILGSRIKDVRTTSSFGFAECFVAATFRENKIFSSRGAKNAFISVFRSLRRVFHKLATHQNKKGRSHPSWKILNTWKFKHGTIRRYPRIDLTSAISYERFGNQWIPSAYVEVQ